MQNITAIQTQAVSGGLSVTANVLEAYEVTSINLNEQATVGAVIGLMAGAVAPTSATMGRFVTMLAGTVSVCAITVGTSYAVNYAKNLYRAFAE